MTTDTTKRPRTREQASRAQKLVWDCVEKAQKTLGEGWNHVSDDLRWGLVSASILSIVVSQSAIDDADATSEELARVARLSADLWNEGMNVRHEGWKRPWG